MSWSLFNHNLPTAQQDPDIPPAADTDLERATLLQEPDIFLPLDDAAFPDPSFTDSFEDLGSKQYLHHLWGGFDHDREVAGLVNDGGYAIRFTNNEYAGISFEDVPSPLDHLHIFAFRHIDYSETVTLICAGDVAREYAYHLDIYSNYDDDADWHPLDNGPVEYTLRFYYEDGGQQELIVPTLVAANTTYLFGMQLEPEEGGTTKLTIYRDEAVDAVFTGLNISAASREELTYFGKNNDGDIEACPNESIADFVVLIPNAAADYGDIVNANGGNFVRPEPPSTPDSTQGVAFYLKADETSLDGPYTVNGVPISYLLNSGPATPNTVHTEVNSIASVISTAEKELGAGSLIIPSRTGASWEPDFDIPIWTQGNSHTFGVDAFQYECFAKSNAYNRMVLGSNLQAGRKSGITYAYGGMSISVNGSASGYATIVVEINGTYTDMLSGTPVALRLEFRGLNNFVPGDFNHYVIGRDANLNWYVFLNGKKAGPPAMQAFKSGYASNQYIHRGGQWLIGSMFVHRPYQQKYLRLAYAGWIDNVRFLLGRVEYTDEFSPPTSPYVYS